ncbi:GMC family oxidoreductase [Cupriavidus gilardii]|uniref:GMC family oxidoreductase n=1 Tax=Cupriavidus gilardii TaxID=82541 RepID=A0A6N1BCR1_9BURK|nr:GMC family oxidoreductase [Cupriavidus gilardii]ALD93208.1 gluconate 2-dehydrogenase alpha chain [Cupriavidus gilardii CR3]QQE08631.1 GMC family oxidoreductase [Cupriavidus sp. ISTL7]KAB0599382.1 GMC family oxidoreductase [Cupriavidus gilardii]MCT9013131.1 GMC family oxidoreductase [Cupriavidus gilardii]MCT9052685.1 GMC family oxidoreductase [Cupriavidus gilardii]
MSKTLERVDAVIVGGGWTGSIIGKELAAAGQRVVMLERGEPRWPSPDFQAPTVHDELRYTRRHALHQNTATETFTFRNDTSQTALPMRRWQFAYPGTHLGGSGNHWSGAYYRFDPTDFKLRSHYERRYGKGIFAADLTAQDWPLTYDELEPYYDRFDYLIGASGFAGNLKGKIQPGGNPFEPWRSRPYPNPPMKVAHASALFGEAAARLGYHPYIQPSALSTRPYTNTEGLPMSACVYCGFCSNFGCEHFAKASPQVCILPAAMKLDTFALRTGAQVLRVELDKDRKLARGVTYVDGSGQQFFQPADMVFLCAFSVHNVRLLLLSGIGKPYDPATGQGVVGRNYTHQTTSGVNLFFDEKTHINPFMGAGAAAVTIDDFSADNFDHGPLGFVGGGYIQIQVVSGAPIGYHPTPRGTPAWGSEWKKAVRRYYNHSASITITGSAMPTRGGYLSLDPTYRDAWGQPLLRITYDLPDNDIKLSAFLTEKGDRIGKAMRGVVATEPGPRKRPFTATSYQSTHLNGGAAMGSDPSNSVVNRFGQCWDVPNVFVTGACLFPQNSNFNPTGTVGATAYWIVDAVKRDYVKAPGKLIA